MRFAYIDSNGNEVPIPSVDALALRIELGAITDDTQLYDAQADQWGPADSHEIFHTLSRSKGGDEGFVAPPPVAPMPAPSPPAAPEAVEALEPDSAADEPEVESADSGLTATDPELTPVEAPDAISELTLAEAPVDSAPDPEPDDDASTDAGELGFGTIDLAPTAEPDEDGEADGPEGDFDFGDMEGGVELEGGFAPADDDEGSGAMDFGGGLVGGETVDPGTDFSGGMELDSPMDFGAAGFEGSGDSLDLETPMSEFTPEAPPGWMEADEGGSDQGEVMDFSSVGSAEEGVVDVPLRDRRTPKNKPSAPKHRRQRAMAAPIVGIVVLLALTVGGYAAWPGLSARFFGGPVQDEPEVFLPPISAQLEPQMRSLANATLAASFDVVRADWAAGTPVETPSTEWLRGFYLANASQFEAVESFWSGMETRLADVRAIDLASFDSEYRVQAANAGVAEADATSMRERADSGFVAGRVDREATYDHVQTLVDAALSLHAFLLANEANIEYVPASTDTTDPVLEANPATPEIRTGMDDRIDTITGALADLGYLDQITAEGLWATVLARVQANGIR